MGATDRDPPNGPVADLEAEPVDVVGQQIQGVLAPVGELLAPALQDVDRRPQRHQR